MSQDEATVCAKCQRAVWKKDLNKEGLCSICAAPDAAEKSIDDTNITDIATHAGHGDPSRIDEVGKKLAAETAAKENRSKK